MVRLRPSIQPSSRSRCTKAATQWPWAAGVPEPKKPMVGSIAGCCARRERPRSRRAAEQRDELAAPDAGHGDFLPCRVASARPTLPTLGLPHVQAAAELAAGPWVRPESF